MSRPWRIEYEDALYHLLARGNERSDFLKAVGEMSQRFDIDIFAYVLMNNHYYLLAGTRRANLKKAMQWFGTTYTKRFKTLHRQGGFQEQKKICQLKNEQISQLFGLSYSGVSHAVKSAKSKLAQDRQLQTKFDQLNSLFKL